MSGSLRASILEREPEERLGGEEGGIVGDPALNATGLRGARSGVGARSGPEERW